jgi:DNA-damage-inducible protein D
MKSEDILQLFEIFENACYDYKGIECWSARELQKVFNYTDWRNFLKAIEKSKEACKNAGEKVFDHFVELNKTIQMPKGAKKEIVDIVLTRYACYLIAQNGDSSKKEIALKKDLKGMNQIEKEHVENNSEVRKILAKRGVKPECLPPAEDVQKVQRRISKENKKALKHKNPNNQNIN